MKNDNLIKELIKEANNLPIEIQDKIKIFITKNYDFLRDEKEALKALNFIKKKKKEV